MSKKIRRRLSAQEWAIIEKMREGEGGLSSLELAADENGYRIEDTPYYWHKSPQVSAFIRNPDYKPPYIDFQDLRDRLVEEMSKYSPKYTKPNYDLPHHPTHSNGKLMIVNPADIHLAKQDQFDNSTLEASKDTGTRRRKNFCHH